MIEIGADSTRIDEDRIGYPAVRARPCAARWGPAGRQVHLFAALAHGSGAVIAQRQVPAATNEVTQFQPLLDQVDLARRRWGWAARGRPRPMARPAPGRMPGCDEGLTAWQAARPRAGGPTLGRATVMDRDPSTRIRPMRGRGNRSM
jgi:hypothetical protein